jgi:hypothetical protein
LNTLSLLEAQAVAEPMLQMVAVAVAVEPVGFAPEQVCLLPLAPITP